MNQKNKKNLSPKFNENSSDNIMLKPKVNYQLIGFSNQEGLRDFVGYGCLITNEKVLTPGLRSIYLIKWSINLKK